MAMDKKNAKAFAIAGFSLLITLYRMGTPFLEQTKKLRKQAEELKVQISTIQQESSLYGKGWEDNISKQEAKIVNRLPDKVPSNKVLEYFLTKFETEKGTGVRFAGVDYQRPVNSDVREGKSRARTVRHKIKGEMAQENLIKYIEHIERFPSLVQVLTFNFTLVPGRARNLDMEMLLDFWLMPNDWVVPGPQDKQDNKDEDDDKIASKNWTHIFGTPESDRKPAGGTEPAATKALPGLPKIEAIIGNSVILDEKIFEEGDEMSGWRLMRVDSQRRMVTITSGSVTKELRVP